MVFKDFLTTAERLLFVPPANDLGKQFRDLEDGVVYVAVREVAGAGAWAPSTGADATESGALVPLWKNDVPGTPFVNGDTVAAPGPLTAATTLFGRRIMVLSASGETVTITMPAIAASNAGQLIGVHDTATVKDYGNINLDPAGTDSIAGGGAGTTRSPVLGEMAPWLEMSSDGNDDWLCKVGMNTVGPGSAFS